MLGDFIESDEHPTTVSTAIDCWRVQCEKCDAWDLFFSDPYSMVVRCTSCQTIIRIK